jgi:hypothetical protein
MTTYKITSERETIKLDVKKVEYSVSLSRTGGQGAQGPDNGIGGFPVELNELTEGDLLTVASQKWTNTKRTNITDGGNF